MAQKTKAPPIPASEADQNILKIVNECRRESEEAKRDRLRLNRKNWEMYFGRQDWSHKNEGQSTEVLPKTSGAVEQFSSFIKRALTQFGDWFSCDTPKASPLTGHQARALLKVYLKECMTSPNQSQQFPTIITNAIKAGLLESLLIIKVHGIHVNQQVFSAEGEKLKRTTRKIWKPRIDLIPSEDYYPDPSGRKLYEIHRVTRDLVDLKAMAEAGIYDKAVVAQITEDYDREHDRDSRSPAQRNQNQTTPPSFRKRVMIDEMWGTIIDLDGKVIQENGMCAIANEKYVIRKPEANPFWHGRSPILAVPLIQVPFSVWGRALYDQASSLNQALNELFNLMLDGGIAEVWGVRQVRTEWLEDPRQVAGGIPQGATLAINSQAPLDGKVVEQVVTGTVPQESMAMFQMADREFQAATLVNDIRLGNLPERTTKATEIVEASSNSSAMIDAFSYDIEREFIEPALEMIFLNIMQNANDLAADAVIEAVGTDAAFTISRMTAAERFAMFAGSSKFKAFGISGTLSRARDFQKMMAVMQAVGMNPLLMQAFLARFSPEKAIDLIFKSLNIDPDSLIMSPEEMEQKEARDAQLMQLMQMMGGSQQQASPQPGMASTQSEVAQNANPTGGVPNGM